MSQLIALDFKTITDEIMALTALRKVTAADPEAGMLVTRDQLPGLRVLARMVFAEAVIALGAAVESSSIDDTDTEADHPFNTAEAPRLEITLRGTDNLNNGMLLTVKRHLEHAVATGILAWVATDADGGFAAMLGSRNRAAVQAVADALNSADGSQSGLIIPGWP